jgi:hypothetical protein
MRRPKQPDDKTSPDDRQPPGGRAWERVKDFERARGVPTQSTPNPQDESEDADEAPKDPKKKRDT